MVYVRQDMAAQSVNHIRVKEPRKLENKESLQSLEQWRTQFRQFMKRDDHYRIFLSSETVWDPLAINYGFATETAGLKRTA